MSFRLLPRALRPALRACTPRAATPLFRALAPRSFAPRLHSTTALTPPTASADAAERPPAYQLWFTCRPCKTRSSHEISKQAYHFGSVLVKCPQCEGRHVISDHLKIFGETARSLEDILADAGWGEKIRLETLAPKLKGLVCDDGSVQIVGDPVEAPLAKEVKEGEQVEKE